MNEAKIGVAVVGCGTVGGSTALLLSKDGDKLSRKCGIPVELKYIVDLNFDYARQLSLDEKLYTDDIQTALDDPEVKIIVELIGGLTIAKKIVEKAVKAGKNVVTANKALLAHYGEELFSLARRNDVCIAFEASCAGGIPIIKAITDGLLANRIEALYGIVNGTCNYVLTEMTENGSSYSDVLKQAQKDGLAEADPTLDVSGMDSAHKLAIMSSLAFGKKVTLDDIPVSGIDNLDLFDVKTGKELGYVLKLLAAVEEIKGKLSLSVSSVFLPEEHPLARVSGPFNAVSVYGSAVGHTMYYGRGAGGSPTASAVVSDVLAVALGIAGTAFKTLKIWPDITNAAIILPEDKIVSRYYIRLNTEDKPGVIASVAKILSEHQISLASILQHEPARDDEFAAIVITTHKSILGDIKRAVAEITQLDAVNNKAVCLRIIEEREESI